MSNHLKKKHLKEQLVHIASNSDMVHKYSAIIIYRNKVIGYGYNYSTYHSDIINHYLLY